MIIFERKIYMDRTILHSDMNSFYASVEIMLNPELRDKAVAVGGNTDERHGIILAKSDKAKKAGVKTGMANWEAKQVCPDLIIVPPQYEQYVKYSKLAREIYNRYTDKVEPYGMDECWLDVTESTGIFGTGYEIAEQIRKTIHSELGLTVSIGVSYNKIFAKLGSDMKKPNAITLISKESFKEQVWPLKVEELLFVGRATTKKLNAIGINTIGDLASYPVDLLKYKFGKNGIMLHSYANGMDISPVMPSDFEAQIKSIGHGITCTSDLENNDDVWKVIYELSQDIGKKLRKHGLLSNGVQISIRTNSLWFKQWQCKLGTNTRSPYVLAKAAQAVFQKNYNWSENLRSITIRAIYLVPDTVPEQLSFFNDIIFKEKRDVLEQTIEKLRARFGYDSITYCSLLNNNKMPASRTDELVMPGMAGR